MSRFTRTRWGPMRRGGGALLALACAALTPIAGAQLAENSRVQLVRGSFGSGVRIENARVVVTGSLQVNPVGAGSAEAARVTVYAGTLAPATFRGGLITPARLQAVLLGTAAAVEPIALDFAGNRDGRIDVADIVALVQKLVD